MRKRVAKRMSFLREDEGASMVEYAIMLALIALVAFGVVITLGQSVSGVFDTMDNELNSQI